MVIIDKLELLGSHRCRDGSYWPLQRIRLGREEGARVSGELGHWICIFTCRGHRLFKRGEATLAHTWQPLSSGVDCRGGVGGVGTCDVCLCRDCKPGYHPLPVSIQRREEKPGRGIRRPGLPLTGVVWPFGINSVSSRGGEALKLGSTSSCCHWLGCGQAEGQHPSLLCGNLVESPEAGERTWADSKQPGAACRLGRSLTPGPHPPHGREQCVGSTSST